ncbi:3-oxoacid CoA-transferase subunit B [Pseudomonas sp. S31]|uniref:3-oxoacid CoA-transferase subunit B n=1 Tax=Pseudomonas sp. S31 TaxID=1564473 RepID=UPI001912E19B|nr:3-oxoacid CoA-transferase subunit B [Pseudomonas sp. S31]MBK5002426.1 3-oxoacid CoA-transferase subunit B [Pseudomonas sp. S31]
MDKHVRNQMAARVAHDIPEGAYVNLGVGLPTLVANHLPGDKEIFLHSENGVLGRWQAAPAGEEDWDMINAGKEPISLHPGAAFFHHADSFGMMRGGHLDICVLGAFQVSQRGDLANWHTGQPGSIPAVGGAMDLAIGAKRIFVMMEHLDKAGRSKLLQTCTYPLTGLACVSRIYTDLATLEITRNGVSVLELVGDMEPGRLQDLTAVELDFSALDKSFQRRLAEER